MNDILKTLLVFGLTASVVVFAWFGKIPTEAFTAFVSAAMMWFLNSKEIDKLEKEKDDLTTKISILESHSPKIIKESDITE